MSKPGRGANVSQPTPGIARGFVQAIPSHTMSFRDHQLRSVCDPRLALHATSARPAWLFAPDGSRVLWANPVGARAFAATSSAALALRLLGPADARRRQIAQLASRLPSSCAARLERLRGFGAAL